MANKVFVVLAIAFAFIAVVSAVATIGGVRDIAGNYHDFTTGQVSSSLTGRVYNTNPYAAGLLAAPLAYGGYGGYAGYAGLAAPLAYGGYAAPYGVGLGYGGVLLK